MPPEAPEPVARGLDGETQRRRVGAGHDPQRLALGPQRTGLRRRELFHQIQTLRHAAHRHRVVGAQSRQRRTRGHEIPDRRGFRRQVALGPHRLALAVREHARATGPGREVRRRSRHGLHHDLHRQTRPPRRQPNPRMGIGRDAPSARLVLRLVVHRALDAELAGETGDRAHEPLPRLDRQFDAPGRDDVHHLLVGRAEAGHLVARLPGPRETIVAAAVLPVRVDPHAQPSVLFLDEKLRVAAGKVDPNAILVEQVRVSGQSVDAGHAQGILRSPAPHIARVENPGRHRPILVGEEVHVSRLLGETLQRHRPALAPFSLLRGHLLAGLEGGFAEVTRSENPGEALRAGTRPLPGLSALFPHAPGHLLDFSQRVLPVRGGLDQRDEGLRAETRAQFGLQPRDLPPGFPAPCVQDVRSGRGPSNTRPPATCIRSKWPASRTRGGPPPALPPRTPRSCPASNSADPRTGAG